jgi:heme A synthase
MHEMLQHQFSHAQAAMLTLAYRPFLDPIELHRLWFLLLIPLTVGIAMAYKAVRVPDMKDYPRQVLVMSVQIVLGMMALGLGAYLLVNVVLPLVAPK